MPLSSSAFFSFWCPLVPSWSSLLSVGAAPVWLSMGTIPDNIISHMMFLWQRKTKHYIVVVIHLWWIQNNLAKASSNWNCDKVSPLALQQIHMSSGKVLGMELSLLIISRWNHIRNWALFPSVSDSLAVSYFGRSINPSGPAISLFLWIGI